MHYWNFHIRHSLQHPADRPEGGAEGGKIIAEGSPEQVAEIEHSYTGKFLKNLMNNKMKKTA